MFEDPKRNQNNSDDQRVNDYKGTPDEEGSAGGVASQDVGMDDYSRSDLNQNTDDEMIDE